MSELRSDIERAMATFAFRETRIFRFLSDPRCPRFLIRRYAEGIVGSARQFPEKIARLLAITPEPITRAALIENLVEEEGMTVGDSGGLTANPGRRHVDFAYRFGRAAGLEEKTLHSAQSESHPWFFEALGRGDWRSAFAYLHVALEGNTAQILTGTAQALSAHGFSDHDMEFLIMHGVADMEHGERAVDVCVATAETEQHRTDILNAVNVGLARLRELYN